MLQDANWQPIETADKTKTIICAWYIGDGINDDWLIGHAKWKSPQAGMIEHWCFEERWTPMNPVAWCPLPPVDWKLKHLLEKSKDDATISYGGGG